MEHAERMGFAQGFTKKVVKKYGRNIITVAVAGTTGMGTDTKFSDLDMIIVTKKHVKDPYKLVYKDTIPEPFYVTDVHAREIASDPSGPWDWITWAMLFMSAKAIYGDDKRLDEYKALVQHAASAKFKKKAGMELVLMREWLNHTQAAAEAGDIYNAVNCAVNFSSHAFGFLVMMNETHYKSHAFLSASKNFKKVPEGFHDLAYKLGTSHDANEIFQTMKAILDSCIRSARENEVKAEFYDSISAVRI